MKQLAFLVALLVLNLAACAPITPSATYTPPIRDLLGGAIYIESSDLLIAESYPVQVSLRISGDLPTPCAEFRSQVNLPDEQNRINVIVWSESDPQAMCIPILEPFEENVPIRMDAAVEGIYSVWLNGELVGEFSYPA